MYYFTFHYLPKIFREKCSRIKPLVLFALQSNLVPLSLKNVKWAIDIEFLLLRGVTVFSLVVFLQETRGFGTPFTTISSNKLSPSFFVMDSIGNFRNVGFSAALRGKNESL